MGDATEKDRSRIEASKEETKHADASKKEESSSEPAAKKKRTAERQITQDDLSEEDGDDEEPADLNAPFTKASQEVLANRKIWTAKRPAKPAATSNSSSSNPFASTLLSAPSTKSSSTEESSTKVFGASCSAFSGFGGFGSGSKTGGSGASSSSTGFGMTTNGPSTTSGFGATTSAGGFGAKSSSSTETETKTTTSLFGNSSGTSGFSFGFAKPSTSASSEASNTAAMTLPENVELTTGEEDEMKMHEVRCKSFKWVVEEEEVEESPKAKETNPSVKPSSNFENKNQEFEKSSDDKTYEEKKGPQHRWQELGIGPIKILRSCDHPDKFRLVQRRESTANGPAHKVILNVPLWKESTCKKTSETHLSVTTVGASGEGETYALKFKENSQAASFSECTTDVCAEAKSCFAEEN
jgi:hypothetical protein